MADAAQYGGVPQPRSARTARFLRTVPGTSDDALPRRQPRLRTPSARQVLPLLDGAALLSPAIVAPELAVPLAIAAVAVMVTFTVAGFYRPQLHLSVLDELPSLLWRGLAAVAVTATTLSLLGGAQVEGRFLAVALLGLPLLLTARACAYKVIRAARRRGTATARTVVLGGGTVAADLAETLLRHPQYGLQPVGYLDSVPATGDIGEFLPHLGEPQDLVRVIDTHKVQVALVAFGAARESVMIDVMRAKQVRDCDVLVVPRLYEVAGGHQGDHIGAIPVMHLRRPVLGSVARITKRAFDVFCSSVALLALAPVMLACAVAVRLEGGPGVIFRQHRVGQDGVLFELYKFRSLRPESGEGDIRWNIAQDRRMGPVGRFLRRTSLDELPQLWNILRGDMTIVGPRPERPHFVDQFTVNIPGYDDRHRVPVGLTGLAQVSGLRGDTSIEHRARYDNYYIENWSLWLDIKVMLRTVREVVGARGG